MPREAIEIIDHVRAVINTEWRDAAETAHLTAAERDLLRGGFVMQQSVDEGWDEVSA